MANKSKDNDSKKEDEIPPLPRPRRVKGFFPLYDQIKRFLSAKAPEVESPAKKSKDKHKPIKRSK